MPHGTGGRRRLIPAESRHIRMTPALTQPDVADMQQAKQQLRRQIRLARRALPAHRRSRLALRLSRQILRSDPFRRAHRIALYLAADSEIDLTPVLHAALRQRKQVYLPVLAPLDDRMHFVRYTPRTRLRRNRFRIAEPTGGARLAPRHLDLVLLPLVAFDPQGHRLGMGGGYYDRTFAFLRNRPAAHRPLLIGVAYELQKRTNLPWASWDVPLAAVATEARLYRFARPGLPQR